MRGGVLAGNGAMILLFEFMYEGKQQLVFDCPYDVRPIENPLIPDIISDKTRLRLTVVVVDILSGIVSVIRTITMSPRLTTEYLSAVQHQLLFTENGERQMREWLSYSPYQLIEISAMRPMGIEG